VPRSTILRRGAAVAAVLALAGAAGADASRDRGDRDRGGDRWQQRDDDSRMFYATTDQNLLVQFDERRPDRLQDVQAITGLPAGVTLRGIDFRPATGDLYGVGSDNIVYRVNPVTAIAIGEGPAFTPGLSGNSFGVDFNPTVDKIRVTSDAAQNLRLNPDEGTVLMADKNLNPGMPQVVGSAYTNSSFSATKPTATQLFAVDAATDQLFLQNPPNDGTLTMGKRLRIDVGQQTGFDIAGDDNVGYLATSTSRSRGSTLYRVDVTTGKTRELGKIGSGRRLVVTGLAAWQD
jgi:Domain of unknown function (DUF4394)